MHFERNLSFNSAESAAKSIVVAEWLKCVANGTVAVACVALAGCEDTVYFPPSFVSLHFAMYSRLVRDELNVINEIFFLNSL